MFLGMHKILPETQVPFYGVLKSYDWALDYARCQEASTKIGELEHERRRIKKIKPAKSEIMANVRESFERGYLPRRKEILQKFLLENWESQDPFRYAERLGSQYGNRRALEPLITLQEIETAIDELEIKEETITAKKRGKALEKIDKTIAGFKAEIDKFSPERFFVADGQIKKDMRAELISFWEELQGNINGPCNPRGLSLNICEIEEQKAWSVLGIKDFVNPRARYEPNK